MLKLLPLLLLMQTVVQGQERSKIKTVVRLRNEIQAMPTYDVIVEHGWPSAITNANLANTIPSGMITYPEASSRELFIMSIFFPEQVMITNIFGQTFYTHTYDSDGEDRIKVTTWPGGVYLIRINGNEVRKFVKE